MIIVFKIGKKKMPGKAAHECQAGKITLCCRKLATVRADLTL